MLSEVTRENEKWPGQCFRNRRRRECGTESNSRPDQSQVYNDKKVTYLKIDLNLIQWLNSLTVRFERDCNIDLIVYMQILV